MNYTHNITQTRFGNHDTYHDRFSEEWKNGISRNHAAYTVALSAVQLPRKSQHHILLVGFINKTNTYKTSAKRQDSIEYNLNILSRRSNQKYPQHG